MSNFLILPSNLSDFSLILKDIINFSGPCLFQLWYNWKNWQRCCKIQFGKREFLEQRLQSEHRKFCRANQGNLFLLSSTHTLWRRLPFTGLYQTWWWNKTLRGLFLLPKWSPHSVLFTRRCIEQGTKSSFSPRIWIYTESI